MRLSIKPLLRSSPGLAPFCRRTPSPSIAAAPSAQFHVSAAPPQLQQAPTVAPGVATAGTPSLLDLCNDPHFVEIGRRPSDRVLRIADEMIGLTVLEVSDVGDLLKKKLKIGNMPMMGFGMGGGMPAGGGAAAGAEAAEEKKKEKLTFNVKLEKFDTAAKIKIIKEIRAFTSLGLKEAKELVEKVPTLVKTGISKEEATDIVAKLTAAGATVVME